MTSSRPAAPTADELLTVDRGADRLALHWYDGADDQAPVVSLWPAMGVPAGYYRPLVDALRAAGLAVAVTDLRGTGASTPRAARASRYGYADLTDDVAAALDLLASRRQGRRTILLGHSLGGQACLLHLARTHDPSVAGLALVGVGLPYWRSYRGVRGPGVYLFTQTIGVVSALLGHWPGWGFGGRQARGVIRDWAYTARTGAFPARPGVDWPATLGRVRTPLLAVSLARDWHTPAPTVDRLVATVPQAPVRRIHLDGDADHFRWARTPGPVAPHLVDFAHHGVDRTGDPLTD